MNPLLVICAVVMPLDATFDRQLLSLRQMRHNELSISSPFSFFLVLDKYAIVEAAQHNQ